MSDYTKRLYHDIHGNYILSCSLFLNNEKYIGGFSRHPLPGDTVAKKVNESRSFPMRSCRQNSSHSIMRTDCPVFFSLIKISNSRTGFVCKTIQGFSVRPTNYLLTGANCLELSNTLHMCTHIQTSYTSFIPNTIGTRYVIIRLADKSAPSFSENFFTSVLFPSYAALGGC